MATLIDSHCHLAAPAFDGDRDAVIARAVEQGVEMIVCPGTNAESSRAAVELVRESYPIVACAGIHPTDPSISNRDDWRRVSDLARDPRVTCIGETGLDYFRSLNDPVSQRVAFTAHLGLAADLGYPIVIHNRSADADILRALTDWRGNDQSRVAILHCFAGPLELLEPAIELGCFFGIGGSITFPGANALRQTVGRIPLDRVLIETDSPFLTPTPRRGERNEPANVALVAKRLADVLGLTMSELAHQTTANARVVFGAAVAHR